MKPDYNLSSLTGCVRVCPAEGPRSPLTMSKRKCISPLNDTTSQPSNSDVAQTSPALVLEVRHADPTKNLKNASPFLIEATIRSVTTGPIVSAKKLKSGVVVIETSNSKQADALLALTSLSGQIPVTVKEHGTRNYSKGVIRTWNFDELTDDQIKENLIPQNVIEVRKLTKIQNVHHNKPPAYALSFTTRELPSSITILYQEYTVTPYHPPPIRCTNCLRYGHSLPCQRPRVCPQCAQTHPPTDSACTAAMKCAACGSSEHDVRSRRCPVYQDECSAMRLSVANGITVPTARQQIREAPKLANPGLSYARAAEYRPGLDSFPALPSSQRSSPLQGKIYQPSGTLTLDKTTPAPFIFHAKASVADHGPPPNSQQQSSTNLPQTCGTCETLLPAIKELTAQVANLLQVVTKLVTQQAQPHATPQVYWVPAPPTLSPTAQKTPMWETPCKGHPPRIQNPAPHATPMNPAPSSHPLVSASAKLPPPQSPPPVSTSKESAPKEIHNSTRHPLPNRPTPTNRTPKNNKVPLPQPAQPQLSINEGMEQVTSEGREASQAQLPDTPPPPLSANHGANYDTDAMDTTIPPSS